MTDLPHPLVPAHIDLAGYEFMPLYGHRLFGSGFNGLCSDAEWRAGVTLWWQSWNQVPAASLPDDNAALARLADLGRDVRSWRKLRAHALHGWVKCSDGRLYHPVLSKLAIEAYDRRVRDRERKAAWRAKRHTSGDSRGDGRGDGDTSRDGDGDSDGDVRSEAKRSEARRSEPGGDSNGAAAGSDGSNARDPAAAAARVRVYGVDPEAVSRAIDCGDVIGVLSAFRCDLSDGRNGEWLRDIDGLQVGTLVVVLAWRRQQGDHVRQPSGFRAARAAWKRLSADERVRIGAELAPVYGVPAPQAAAP